MKICVVSMCDPEGAREEYPGAHANHVGYCEHNGYLYYEENEFAKYGDRHKINWYKPCVILDAMRSHPDCDYFLWADMDIYFTNFNTRIESFIPDDRGHIYMSKGSKGGRGLICDEGWCNGLFIVRNTQLSLRFMQAMADAWIYKCFKIMKQSGVVVYMDQAAMTALNHIGEFSGIITEIPGHDFHGQPNGKNNNKWHPGYFCIHLAGYKGHGRRKHLCKLLGMNMETGVFPGSGLED